MTERTNTKRELRTYKHIEHNQGEQKQVKTNLNNLTRTGKYPNSGRTGEKQRTLTLPPLPIDASHAVTYPPGWGGGEAGSWSSARPLWPWTYSPPTKCSWGNSQSLVGAREEQIKIIFFTRSLISCVSRVASFNGKFY